MRVLLITPIFFPEPCYLRGLPFVRELARRGMDVEVLTGFPNYPTGRIYCGYRQRFCYREMLEGVQVIRLPAYLSHDSSGLRRAASYLCMAASMSLQGPLRVARPDLIHVFQGNAALCLPAEIISRICGAPILLDVADLWPESVLDSNMFHLPGGARLLQAWCRHTFRRARHIVALSEGVKARIMERGVSADKVSVLYNWCDAELEKPLPPRENCECYPELKDTFNVIYAGTFGPLQALQTVLEAAERLLTKKPKVRLVLVGGGVEEQALKQIAMQKGLQNVVFIPRQPIEKLNRILALADAVLIHLKNSSLNQVGIPSKVQHCLAIGRPILVGALGCTLRLVEAARAGVAFQPENPVQLAEAIDHLESLPRPAREAMGRRGREFYFRKLSFAMGMDRLVGIYQRTLAYGSHPIGGSVQIDPVLQSGCD